MNINANNKLDHYNIFLRERKDKFILAIHQLHIIMEDVSMFKAPVILQEGKIAAQQVIDYAVSRIANMIWRGKLKN